MYRHNDGGTVWRISAGGQYVDAQETEFEMVRRWLRPRGVVVPSLNGGWLTISPFAGAREAMARLRRSALERWGRQPTPADFLGFIGLVVPGTAVGFPVLWDRERQLKLMYFLGGPDSTTGGFPYTHQLDWPDPELQIDGVVTIDAERGLWSEKAAALDVTLRNPIGDHRHVSARLLVPAYTCQEASEALVDMFPSVSTDDLDFD
jgi:hypothetical protein